MQPNQDIEAGKIAFEAFATSQDYQVISQIAPLLAIWAQAEFMQQNNEEYNKSLERWVNLKLEQIQPVYTIVESTWRPIPRVSPVKALFSKEKPLTPMQIALPELPNAQRVMLQVANLLFNEGGMRCEYTDPRTDQLVSLSTEETLGCIELGLKRFQEICDSPEGAAYLQPARTPQSTGYEPGL